MSTQTGTVTLREITPEDFTTIFEFERDQLANQMAAFTAKDPNDRAAFDAHKMKILNNPECIALAVEADGVLVGTVGKFDLGDQPNITYWIGREFWGRGYATSALKELLHMCPERPIYGRAAFDNIASQKVLEKCGFVKIETDMFYANARQAEIEEVIFKLDR